MIIAPSYLRHHIAALTEAPKSSRRQWNQSHGNRTQAAILIECDKVQQKSAKYRLTLQLIFSNESTHVCLRVKKASPQPSKDLLTNSVKKKKGSSRLKHVMKRYPWHIWHGALCLLVMMQNDGRPGRRVKLHPFWSSAVNAEGPPSPINSFGRSNHCYVNVWLHTTASDEGVTSCEVITEGKTY